MIPNWEEVTQTEKWKGGNADYRRKVRDWWWTSFVKEYPDAPHEDLYVKFYEKSNADIEGPTKAGAIGRGILRGATLGIPLLERFVPESEREQMEQSARMYPKTAGITQFATEMGTLGGVGKGIHAVTKGLFLRSALWGGAGAGRAIGEQVAKGEEISPAQVAKEAALWGGGALAIEGLFKGLSLLRRPRPIQEAPIEGITEAAIPKERALVPIKEDRFVSGMGEDGKWFVKKLNVIDKGSTKFKPNASYQEIVEEMARYDKPINFDSLGEQTQKMILEEELGQMLKEYEQGGGRRYVTESFAKKPVRWEWEHTLPVKGGAKRNISAIRSGKGKLYKENVKIAISRTKRRLLGQDTVGIDVTPSDAKPPISPRSAVDPPMSEGAIDYAVPAQNPRSMSWWDRWVRPTKQMFQRLQEKSNIPAYREIYVPIENARTQIRIFEKNYEKQIRDIFGKYIHNHSVRRNVTYILEGRGDELMQMGLTPADLTPEVEIAGRLRKVYDNLFKNFDIDPWTYLQNYSPRIRAQGYFDMGIVEPALRKKFRFFAELHRTGELMPREEDALLILKRYIRAGGKKKFLLGPWENAVKFTLNHFKEGTREWRSIERFLLDMYGYSEASQVSLEAILKKTGLFGKIDPTSRTNLINLMLQGFYGGALAGRPMPIIRNMFQTLHTTYPLLGEEYLAKGIRAAFDAASRDECRRLGMLLDDYLAVPLGEEISRGLGKAGNVIETMNKVGMYAYRKADTFNRVVAYHGAKQRAADALRKAGSNWTKFYEGAKLNRFRKAEIEQLKGLFDTGRNTDLLERVGTMMAEDTQWIYRVGNAPEAMRRPLGRIALQFATWPANYAEYFQNLMRIAREGDKGPLTRFVGLNLAAAGVGMELFGVDIRSWVFPAPFVYSGGPVAGLTIDGVRALGALYYGSPMAGYEIKKFARNLPLVVPGGLFARQLISTIKNEGSIMEYLGFKEVKEEK